MGSSNPTCARWEGTVGVVMYTHNCQRSQWGKDQNQAKIKEDETGEFAFFSCILSDLHCTTAPRHPVCSLWNVWHAYQLTATCDGTTF